MSGKLDSDLKQYVRDDTLNDNIELMITGTAYHGEVTAVTSSYTSGSCQVLLGAACKHLMILAEGTDDVVYCVMDSTSADSDLTGSTTNRYKFKGTTAGWVTSISLGTAITTLDFLKRNSGSTIAVFVDAFT